MVKQTFAVATNVVWLALGLFELYVGYLGFAYWFPGYGLLAAIIGAVLFVPYFPAIYVGAVYVLGWHWLPALLLTCCGLMFPILKGLAEAGEHRRWPR